MTDVELIMSVEEKMEKTIQAFQRELGSLKAGRANPQILDRIMVDYYGSKVPVNQVGNISAPEPRVLVINVWEASMLKTVEKAIQASDLGINPINDGKVIRLVIPELTEERRKELVKILGKTGETSKVSIRSVRREAIEQLKKMEKKAEITEDDLADDEEEIQKLHDRYIKKIEELQKEKEIMAV